MFSATCCFSKKAGKTPRVEPIIPSTDIQFDGAKNSVIVVSSDLNPFANDDFNKKSDK